MPEPNAVPLIVLSVARDPVEAINSVMRRAGQAVHCTWLPALRDLGDALAQLNPQLLVHVANTAAELAPVIGVRDQLAPDVPVLLLAPALDEAEVAQAITLGARDVVTLASPARLEAVVLRELARLPHRARAQRDASSPHTMPAVSWTTCCSAPTTPSSRCRKASSPTPIPPGTSCTRSRTASAASRSWTCSRNPRTRPCAGRWPPASRDAGATTRCAPTRCSTMARCCRSR